MSKRIGVFCGAFGFRCILDALLKVFVNQKAEMLCSLGDLIGLGNDSDYCINTVFGNNGIVIAGKMEQTFVSDNKFRFISGKASMQMNEFARKFISKKNREIISSLPAESSVNNTLLVGNLSARTPDCMVNGETASFVDLEVSKAIVYPTGYMPLGPCIFDATTFAAIDEVQLSWERIAGRPIFPGLTYFSANIGKAYYLIVSEYGIEFGCVSYDVKEIFSYLTSIGVSSSYIRILRGSWEKNNRKI